MVLPAIVGIYTQLFTDEPIWELSVHVSSIFVPSRVVPYIFAYAWHVYQCHLIATGAVVVESLLTEYQICISALFKIIHDRFRNLKSCSQECNGSDGRLCSFRQVVKFHQDLIELTQSLSTLYTPIIFAQFFITAIAVCILGFLLLVGGTNYFETFILVMFAAAVLVQPLIYSYSGERIEEESCRVADAVYESFWFEMKPKDRELLCLCIFRAQKPLKLDSPFYKVNLMTFSNVSEYITGR